MEQESDRPKPVLGSIPLGQWPGSDATNALHSTIAKYQEASRKQTRQMLRLTWAIVILTVAMLLGLFVQIWLALAGNAVD